MKRLALIVILAAAGPGAGFAVAAADPVLQLLEKRCASCHKEDETPTLHGGISLEALKKSTDDVKAIIERVKLPADSKKRMPKSKGKPGDKEYLAPLTKAELALIEKLGKAGDAPKKSKPGGKEIAGAEDKDAGTEEAKPVATAVATAETREEPAKDPKEAVEAAAAALPADANKKCPIMTTETVDPDLNSEYAGKTVYFCCPKCQRLWGTHANYVIKARGTEALPQFKGMEEELGLEAISLLPQRFCPVEKGALILPGCPTVTYKGEKVFVFNNDDVKTWNKDPDKHAKLAVADGVLPQLKGKVEIAAASTAATDTAPADTKPAAPPTAAAGSQVTTAGGGDLAKSVLKLFETRCAACHGQNATEPKKFRVIDALDKLRDSNLLNLQVPEDSKLYSVLKDGEMPYLTRAEKQAGKKTPDPVTDEEVATVLSWIRAGAPTVDGAAVVATKTEEKPVEQAPKRALVTPADEMTAAMADLQSVLREDQTDTRYVSISVAHNHAGVTDDQLENLRRGARKMLNSLSTGPRIATFPEVGPQKTLLRVRLTDIGWDAKQWDHVAAHFPHAIDTGVTAALGAACKASVPILRADWMAATATRPPLYHDILKLPKTQRELEKQLDVKVADNLKRGQAIRSGISKSGVSLANRLVERHDLGRGGAYWLSYDFKSSGGRASLLQFPLGPKTFPDGSAALLGGKLAFEHAGGEMVFTLPNGLHGYYVADTLGNRLDGAAPTNIVSDRDNVTGRVEISNGLSCIMCHDKGLKDGFPKDEVRSIAATFGSEEQRMIERLHVEPADFAARMAKDMASFAAAVKEANAEPMAGQREGVGQFARLYEDEVTFEQAAAEIGLSPAVLMEKMEAVPSLTDLRITFRGKGSLQREHFNDRFPELVKRLTNDTVKDAKDLVTVGSTTKLENLKPVPILLSLDKTTYREGDIPKIDLEASEDCHVRLLYQDARGDITILFPNQFIESDKVSKGKARLLPAVNPKKAGDEVAIEIFGGDDGKTFGTERLVAIATDQSFTDNAALLAAARDAFDKYKVPFATHDSKSLDLAVTKAARAITRQSTTAGTSKIDKVDSARTGFSTVTITTKAK